MTFASKVQVEGKSIITTREVDGGEEVVKADTPLIITTDLRLNIPRFINQFNKIII